MLSLSVSAASKSVDAAGTTLGTFTSGTGEEKVVLFGGFRFDEERVVGMIACVL